MARDILPPKNDVVFKLLFGDQSNGDLLIDFLKAVIRLPEDDYSEITVVNPHLLRKHPDKKLGILDLKIKTNPAKSYMWKSSFQICLKCRNVLSFMMPD